MEINIRLLDILFQKIPAASILARLRRSGTVVDLEDDRKLFECFAVTSLQEYSLDELSIIFSRFQTETAKCALHSWHNASASSNHHRNDGAGKLSLPKLAFYSVLDQADRMLIQQSAIPLCRIDKALTWRDSFLSFGQDLFVCAFLAYQDLRNQYERYNFAWPAVIKTDHKNLNYLLSQGIAENHYHLFGSSQTFALSWSNLMTYSDSHFNIGKEFDHFHQPIISIDAENSVFPTKDRVKFACLCRSYLFQWLKSKEDPCSSCCIAGNNATSTGRCWANGETGQCLFSTLEEKQNCPKTSLWNWINELYPEMHLENDLRQLRVLYGAHVPQPDGSTDCLDYALEEHVFRATPDACYRSLAGERSFLYNCFKSFFSGEMSERTSLLFYLYLLLKTQFRNELIQVNKQYGFRNFSNYQDRKTLLCNRPCYWAELYRMALNAPLTENSVSSLEARIVPRSTPEETKKRIIEADEMKRYADCSYERILSGDIPRKTVEELNYFHTPYFFVFHFTKKRDIDPRKHSELNLTCRHNSLRNTIQQQAIALADCLSNSPYLCQRVRGIDSASHEIGCPPEVFAVAFRFLRGFHTIDYQKKSLIAFPTEHLLSATYHVGEDFIDIASALRAIDEAITFLELQRSDRIGHALGLGIDPEEFYSLKGNRIFISKQDRLDDLVWLLYQSRLLGVHMDPHLYGSLKKEAEILLWEIYGHAITENNWHITLSEYECCMLLRADDPSLYSTMEYRHASLLGTPYNQFMHSTIHPEIEKYRRNKAFAGMNYYYHYGHQEKICGQEICEIEISPEYVHLMRQSQDALQKKAAEKGIIIECNPSSNVLIGTFRQYHKHPIIRFFNAELEMNSELRSSCSQLQVCVNTDDLGVFDTSLEFEYALLFQALAQLRRQDGSRIYCENDILKYLDSIRNMGHRAVFPQPSILEHSHQYCNK